MIVLWRLSNSLDLQPRARPAGRWHGAGEPVVLLDASPAAAVFARLAQTEVDHPHALPRHYFLLEVAVPDHAVSEVPAPVHWQTDTAATRALGNAWLARGDTLLLRVPSLAGGVQYLLNAGHPQLAQCQILSSLAPPFDPHLSTIAAAVQDGVGWLVAGWAEDARDLTDAE